ncbi:MAG: MaoC/PaaZ C-terminal domain-containing protein [Alphaproteobacteria bacterium]
MAVTYETLMNWKIPDVKVPHTKRDTMLYALGLGFGADPLDEKQLRFVYEKNLLSLPTMAVVLGAPGSWIRETGCDYTKLLHGEQGIVMHRPIPVEGTLIGRTKVVGVIDKGQGKGALVYTTRELTDASSGALICAQTSTVFLRGDGGLGGPSGPTKPIHELPDRAPDKSHDIPTLPQQALIYRLSGDYNPLHADPAVGRAAGFKMPILHGLCTFGICGHAVLKAFCDYDPARLKSFALRFTSPVMPGETIRTEMWKDGNVVSFRATVVERNVVAVNNGRAEIA